MSNLTLFEFREQGVRTLTLDGEPWFVLADLTAILGIGNSRMVANRLDEDMKGVSLIDTPGGRQKMTIVSEPGMYDVIVRSDSALAAPFRRWVTGEVLPQIRKTGSYGVAELTGPELMARALIEAQSTLAAKDEQIAQLEPKAEAFDGFIGAEGDYSFNQAAKLLQRRGVDTGQFKLVKLLEEWGWIYRGAAREPRAKQAQIDTKRLAEKTHWFIDQATGEKRAGRTAVRVTPKGIDDIHARIGGQQVMEVSA